MTIVEVRDKKNKKDERLVRYHIEDRLKANLDKSVVDALEKKDKDFVMVIDGIEGGGKSTLAFQIGRYVDPTLDLSRVVFDAESFREAVLKAKKGQCIIYDEAFTGFSSRSALSGINRALVSLAMQMRQQNLFIIIVLPTIFLLDKYIALFRAKVLIHVYENKGIRGYFRVYPSKLKKLLIMNGAKTFSYKVRTGFKGRFYGVFALGDEDYNKLYRSKKEKALQETSKDPMSAGQVKYRTQRDIFLYLLRKNTNFTYQEIENMANDYDIDMSYVQIRNICVKFGDKPKESEVIQLENEEKADKKPRKSRKRPESDQLESKEEENEEIIEETEEIVPKIQEMDDFDEKTPEIDENELDLDENDGFNS